MTPLLHFVFSAHMVLIGGSALDLATTRIAIHNGAHEIGIAGNGIRPQVGLIAFHIATAEALSYAAKRGGHPKMARNNLLIHGLFHVSLAAWNIHVIQQQKEKHGNARRNQ